MAVPWVVSGYIISRLRSLETGSELGSYPGERHGAGCFHTSSRLMSKSHHILEIVIEYCHTVN